MSREKGSREAFFLEKNCNVFPQNPNPVRAEGPVDPIEARLWSCRRILCWSCGTGPLLPGPAVDTVKQNSFRSEARKTWIRRLRRRRTASEEQRKGCGMMARTRRVALMRRCTLIFALLATTVPRMSMAEASCAAAGRRERGSSSLRLTSIAQPLAVCRLRGGEGDSSVAGSGSSVPAKTASKIGKPKSVVAPEAAAPMVRIEYRCISPETATAYGRI